MAPHIFQADYANPDHARDLLELLDSYARDPMGGGKPLDPLVIRNLVPALSRLPGAFSLLAYLDGMPAGLANCFESFSTFACRPVINIHDFMVASTFRGRGLSQHLLHHVESIARQRQCCKITLEVLSGNQAARGAYRKFGFNPYSLDPAAGNAGFWQKELE